MIEKEAKFPMSSKQNGNNSTFQLRKRRWETTEISSETDQQSTIDIKQFKCNDNQCYGKLTDYLNAKDKLNDDLVKKLHSAEEINKNQAEEIRKLREKLEKSEKIDKHELESVEKKISTPITPTAGKSFVLKHIFKNVPGMEEGKRHASHQEEHFGVSWGMYLDRDPKHLRIYIGCAKPLETEKWSIGTKCEVKIVSKYGKLHVMKFTKPFEGTSEKCAFWGWDKFMEWDKMEKDYLVDGNLSIEVSMEINKTIGVYKENLKCFDETLKEFSDMVLVVKDTKFYILKLYLASHCPYFKTMFLGRFQESKKSEIKLSGIDADDFQNYLEVLYGEYAIDETTVEGILLVADMYDTPIVIRKCEEFLLEKSEKKLKKKLEMSTRYNLEKLKKTCLDKINDFNDIRSVIPGDIHSMDPTIIGTLLEKSLEMGRISDDEIKNLNSLVSSLSESPISSGASSRASSPSVL